MGKRPPRDYTGSPYLRTLPNGNQEVQCRECGTWVSSLRHTHFKGQHCTGKIKNNDEYRSKYPDSPVFPPSLSQKVAVTEARMIATYGEEEGRDRWKQYCNKQAETNTLAYKQTKLGWTQEQFDDYNSSRAVTLDNMIKRHGQTLGEAKWKEYCDIQRYTTSREYFVEQYGEKEGDEKFKNFNIARGTISKPEQELFNTLKEYIPELEQQIVLDTKDNYRPFDMGNESKKKLIEFYGTYFHCDIRKFDKDYYNQHLKKKAEDMWEYDAKKNQTALDKGYDLFIVREMDWINDQIKVLQDIVHWWNVHKRVALTEQQNYKREELIKKSN